MKIIYLFAVFFIPIFCWGQFSVNGLLISNDTPVANCPIKLIQMDKVMKSAVSDENGEFEFQNVPEGKYTLETVSIFYETYSQEITISSSDISLGVISISEKPQELTEVVISARKNPVVPTSTGTLIDVAGSRLKNRENIFLILKYVPSISIINGLKIFGSDDILVVLDGKELNLSKDKIEKFLDKIPVRSIQSIEVIDRADAGVQTSKFGVIKINTIQKQGWSGSLSQEIFFHKKFEYTNDASLFYTTDNYRLFGTFYYRRGKNSYKDINNQILKDKNVIYNNSTEAELKRKVNNFIFGTDYYLSKKSELSFLYVYDYDTDEDHNRNTRTDVFRNSNYDYLLTSKRLFDQVSKDYSLSLNFNSRLDTLGSTIKMTMDFMNKKYINPLSEEEIYQQVPIIEKKHKQESISNSLVYAFSASWNKKITNKQQFSLGTRLSLVDNKDYFEYLDILGIQHIRNANFSNDFFLKEYILAVFSNYSFPVGEKSSMAFGVRSEYNYNDFTNTKERYNNDNTRWLFSAQYTTKLWENNFYIFGVKRINRVNYYLFNPTYVKSSPTSAYTGNKDLKPVDVYQLQTGYSIGRVNFALVYRYFQNNILSRPSDTNGILTTRPENIGYRNDIYIFASAFHKFNDWWEGNFKFTGGNLNFKLPNKKFNSLYGEAHLTQRFYLPLEMEFEAEYVCTSGYYSLYTKNYYNNSFNIRLFYPISDAFELSISANDIFNTSHSKSKYDFNNVYNYNFNKGSTRSFGLSISYEFSKGKKVKEDIRDSGVENEKNRLR